MAERLGHSERSVRRIAAEILTKLGPEALAILCLLDVVYKPTVLTAMTLLIARLGPEALAMNDSLGVVCETTFPTTFALLAVLTQLANLPA